VKPAGGEYLHGVMKAKLGFEGISPPIRPRGVSRSVKFSDSTTR
jgi:hypothetical protein